MYTRQREEKCPFCGVHESDVLDMNLHKEMCNAVQVKASDAIHVRKAPGDSAPVVQRSEASTQASNPTQVTLNHCCACAMNEDAINKQTSLLEVAWNIYEVNRLGDILERAEKYLARAFSDAEMPKFDL